MKRGFTLIEVIMGLFLLGLIIVSVLPIANGAFYNLSKQKTRYNMIYTGEMVVERIKAFDCETSKELFVYDVEIGQLIEEFRGNDYIEISLDKEGYDYPIKIIKENKSDSLWKIAVIVYNKDGGKSDSVELKAYLPKK